jgi:hypothetical protein
MLMTIATSVFKAAIGRQEHTMKKYNLRSKRMCTEALGDSSLGQEKEEIGQGLWQTPQYSIILLPACWQK